MYKAIIVDDEIWIIEGLKKGVNWAKYGFEVVGQAQNGKRAMELVEELHPHVVVTDIRMPDISGLEFLNYSKSIFPDTVFIVISGYAEFAYAQKALNSGAFAFILKPFDYQEIEEILLKTSHTLANNNLSVSPVQLEMKYDENVYKKNFDKWIKERNIQEDRPAVVLASVGNKPLFAERNEEIAVFKTGTKEFIYIINKNKFALGDISTYDMYGIEGVGIASEAWDEASFKISVDEALIAAYEFFLIPSATSKVFYYRDLTCKEIGGVLNVLEEAIQYNNLALLNSVIKDIKSKALSRNYTIRSMMIFYNAFVTFIDQKYGGKVEDNYMCSNAQIINTFDNLNLMLEYLKNMMVSSEPPVVTPQGDDISKKLVAYVNSNYCEKICAQDIAAQYYLSVSLFCQLFRRETRQTFTEYVTNLRIGKACELLKNPEVHIYDIAQNIGFSDYFYFSRIFRKYTGKSPTEYRELLMRDQIGT